MTGKNTKPHQLRKSGKKAANKIRRRQEAEARSIAYSLLSDVEKKAKSEAWIEAHK